ncbi:uncharacterized protein LOC129585411 [Paramacrobiotus metropolitanus]|uniref:uncharacterized protein LOC129585411 n=1 Tax=Paramacrobiotus metropolitanus TaxID=2943436 RepID=UPI002445B17D|nr:uncharacterized protein LOC129585411 [Paramacrobiotus metropolitanus]
MVFAKQHLVTLTVTILIFRNENVCGIRCYQCMGTQPGCSTETLDWRLVKNLECPDPYDACVKITDTVLGSNLTTRGCLSTFISVRRDIPADKYEGCRLGAHDIRLNKDVIVSEPHQKIVERTHHMFCFCSWDNYCNSSLRKCTTGFILQWSFLLLIIFGYYL